MTKSDSPADLSELSGEERFKKRRIGIGKLIAIGCLIGLGLGLLTGIIGASVEEGVLPAWLLIPMSAALVIGVAWYSVIYFKRIDELDLADNLWAGTIALYGYVCMLPLWNMLHTFGVLGPPNHWGIYTTTIAIMLIAYFGRKWMMR